MMPNDDDDKKAKARLSSSGSGIDMTEKEFAVYNVILSDQIAKGGSVYSASKLAGVPSKTTVCRHVNAGYAAVKPKDLPRQGMLKKRKRKEKPMSPYEYGGSYASKEGRQYDDYIKFRRENPGLYTTQFDFLGAQGIDDGRPGDEDAGAEVHHHQEAETP